MHALARLSWSGALALAISLARAETWQTTHGERCEGTLSGVYGTTVVIAGKVEATMLPLESLDDAALGRVADFLAARAKAPVAWADSTAKVAKSLRGRLQIMREGKLVEFDPGGRPEPEIYLVYFGAFWCGPCRAFSPDLVKAYRGLKQLASDRFELVFVSSDKNANEQEAYIREAHMPWPVLNFYDLGNVWPIERWDGPGIPSLVVLTREGEILYNSYHGEEYVGPRSVLAQAESLLRAMSEETGAPRPAAHRLALLQYLRTAGSATRPPTPYLIALDRSRYGTLEVKKLTATLEIDEQGKVTSAHFEPQLPPVLDYQLVQDAGNWLFLPALDHGQPKRVRVSLPLML